ncbi:MAG: glycoside hydrolase family protein, partial [Methylophagaceae bacterium]
MNQDNVYKQLQLDEGIKYEIYNDHLGYPTFGVGHLITKQDEEFGLEVGTRVSEDRVKSVFMQDLHTSIRECLILYRED